LRVEGHNYIVDDGTNSDETYGECGFGEECSKLVAFVKKVLGEVNSVGNSWAEGVMNNNK
jgi:hypothetical protein